MKQIRELLLYIACFSLIIFIFLPYLSAYQGSSTSYSADIKQDSFSQTNSTSASFSQRFIGGIAAVGQYIVSTITGRFGILSTTKNLAINITYPLNNQEVARGNDLISGEDDRGAVPNSITLVARVFENGTDTGFSSATCYFYDGSTYLGSSATNASGHCTKSFAKSTLSVGARAISVNYSVSTSDVIVVNTSQINMSIVKYNMTLTESGQRSVVGATAYYDGDSATIDIAISKVNSTGTYAYDPVNISANATNSAGTVYENGTHFYPGANITKISAGNYRTQVIVNYTFGIYVKWDVWLSNNNFTDIIGSALHEDLKICSADFGAWTDWSACSSTCTQSRTRTDSSGCIESESQSCGDCTGGPTSCFPAGTKVLMENGSEKNIENVKVGDEILSYDFGNNSTAPAKVLELESPVREGYYSINNLVNVTDEHPFYIKKKNGNFVWASINPEKAEKDLGSSSLAGTKIEKIEKIEIGDYLFDNKGNLIEIKSIDYFPGEIQTYNLKSVDKFNVFFANNFLVHNKGCIPSWSAWSDWSECNAENKQTRTRTDGCGKTETDEKNCGPCIENWRCDWTSCEGNAGGYSYAENCTDLNECGTQINKPYRRECGVMNLVCSDWSTCLAEYNLADVLRGNPTLSGTQQRVCFSPDNILNQTVEFRKCSMNSAINLKKTKWCFQDYLEVYDADSNKLIGRMRDYAVSGVKTVNIGLVATDFEGYCDYCYDGIKNYDEVNADCGGACPVCKDKGTFFDWLLYFKIFLWLLLILLVALLIYENSKEAFRHRYEERRISARKPIKSRKVWSLSALMPKFKMPRFKLPAIDIRIKIGRAVAGIRQRRIDRRMRKEAERRIKESEKRQVRHISRKSKVLMALSAKLRGWKSKAYYNTALLERNLKQAIENYSARRHEKKLKEAVHKMHLRTQKEKSRVERKAEKELNRKRKLAKKLRRKQERIRAREIRKAEKEKRKLEKMKIREARKKERARKRRLFWLGIIRRISMFRQKRAETREIRRIKKARKKQERIKLREEQREERQRRKAEKRMVREKRREEKYRIRAEKRKIKELKHTEKRKIKEKKKVHKKVKRAVRHEARKIKKRIKRKEVHASEIKELRNKLKEWHARGYYDTVKLQKELDTHEGKNPLK